MVAEAHGVIEQSSVEPILELATCRTVLADRDARRAAPICLVGQLELAREA